MTSRILTLAADDDERVFRAVELVVEWCVFVSGTAGTGALAAEFVTGNDSGTVCNVVRIVVDILYTFCLLHRQYSKQHLIIQSTLLLCGYYSFIRPQQHFHQLK